jgi:hypothetical protein
VGFDRGLGSGEAIRTRGSDRAGKEKQRERRRDGERETRTLTERGEKKGCPRLPMMHVARSSGKRLEEEEEEEREEMGGAVLWWGCRFCCPVLKASGKFETGKSN